MTLEAYIESLRGKKIAALGIGVSNTPLIELLAGAGLCVTACDKRMRGELGETAQKLESVGVKLRLGADYLTGLEEDVIFRTPGMHPHTPELMAAQAAGAAVTSEMEAFFQTCPCKIIAITGSDGKTTTSSVIAEILRAGGHTVHLGGNIGRPLLAEVPRIKKEDLAVLELSSFQLHSMKCAPDVAVVTNVSPNHLDIHPSLDDYINAKRSIFLGQDENCRLVLNLDNPVTRGFAGDARAKVLFFSRREAPRQGVFLRDGMIYSASGGAVESILPASGILIPGAHNIENYMAAFCAVRGLADNQACRSVAETYKGVVHRLELVGTIGGVRYINDSIASSPTRTIAGLRSFEQKPILIAGGYDKKIPFDELADEIVRRAKALYLCGHTAEKIRNAVANAPGYDPVTLPVTVAESFREAVTMASTAARAGDIVLLSPACASFDSFRDFAQRGEAFRAIVRELAEGLGQSINVKE